MGFIVDAVTFLEEATRLKKKATLSLSEKQVAGLTSFISLARYLLPNPRTINVYNKVIREYHKAAVSFL